MARTRETLTGPNRSRRDLEEEDNTLEEEETSMLDDGSTAEDTVTCIGRATADEEIVSVPEEDA